MTSTTSHVTPQYQRPMLSPSTTSSSTTLVTFTSPRRSNTASSTSTAHSTLSEASTLSQSTNYHSHAHPSHFHSDVYPTARSRGRSQTYPVHAGHGVPTRNKNSDVTMTPQQAELLRYKGTYTDSGRHSDDWLFGGWSFVGTVKGAWRKVAPGTNGRSGEAEGEQR